MPEFSAADAAFTGFRVVSHRPWVVLVWAAFQFAFALGSAVFLTLSGGDAYAKISDLSIQPMTGDATQAVGLLQTLAPTYAALFVAGLVYYAIFWAAMNRAVFTPQESRFAYLRLASDELRQLGLFALLAGLFAAVYVAIFMVATVVVVLVSLATGSTAAVGLMLALVVPALIVAILVFAVRFSLASPLTYASGKIDLFGSWRMTHRRFWPLLGAYLIAVALSFVVLALTLAIAVAAVAVLGGMGALGEMLQPHGSSLQSVLTPTRLVYLAVSSVGGALSAPVTMTAPAAIYRAIAGNPAFRAARQ